MPDYKQAKIYKIVCNITGKTYYGSTTASLTTRLRHHRGSYNSSSGRNCATSQIICGGDYNIELVELFPCENRTELLIKEREYIENNECVNIQMPYRTEEELKIAKKEYLQTPKMLEYHKNYRVENRDKNKLYLREYHKIHKEETIAKRREEYKLNRDVIRERNKSWYDNGGNEYLAEKCNCECGSVVARACLFKHRKTKKHQAYINHTDGK